MTVLDPTLLGERRVEDGLERDLEVPPELAFLEGHFEGMPVVPGVVQLHWAIRAASEALGRTKPPRLVERLRFRGVLRPGDRFQLELRAAGPDAPLDFAYRRADGERISEGRVGGATAASAPVGPGPEDLPALPAGPFPPVPELILNADPMRLLDRVLGHDRRGTRTAGAAARAALFADRDGRIPAWVALEHMAQGIAAHGGLRLVDGGKAPPLPGLLLAARRLELSVPSFAPDEELELTVRHLSGNAGLARFECAVDGEQDRAATGTIQVFWYDDLDELRAYLTAP